MFKKFLSFLSIGIITSTSTLSVVSCGKESVDNTPWHNALTGKEITKFEDVINGNETVRLNFDESTIESLFNYKKEGTYANIMWDKINDQFLSYYNYKENNSDDFTIAEGMKNSLIENFDLNWNNLSIITDEGQTNLIIQHDQWEKKISELVPKNINRTELGVAIVKKDSKHFSWPKSFPYLNFVLSATNTN